LPQRHVSHRPRLGREALRLDCRLTLLAAVFACSYVPDRKFDFHPGTSEILPLRDAVKRLEDIMAETRYVVGHNFKSDLKLLGSSGFRLPPNVTIFDTDVGRCKSSAACASTIAPCAFSGNL